MKQIRSNLEKQYKRGIVLCKTDNCKFHSKTVPQNLRVKNKNYKDGFARLCADCNRAKTKKWSSIEENKLRIREKVKQWVKDNPDKARDRFRKWQRKNADKIRTSVRLNNRQNKSARTGYIYFLECPLSKMVKIGFAKDFDKRMKQYRTHSPVIYKVLLLIKGSEYEEGDLVSKYHNQKVDKSFDWMAPSKDFWKEIKALKKRDVR